MQHVLYNTMTTDDMHATLTQASTAQVIPLNDTCCTKNILWLHLQQPMKADLDHSLRLCIDIYRTQHAVLPFRVIVSDALLWLTRHAMPCGKHMKQHDAQLALGHNPLAYKVCIVWDVCCEMARLRLATAKTGKHESTPGFC